MQFVVFWILIVLSPVVVLLMGGLIAEERFDKEEFWAPTFWEGFRYKLSRPSVQKGLVLTLAMSSYGLGQLEASRDPSVFVWFAVFVPPICAVLLMVGSSFSYKLRKRQKRESISAS